MTRHDPADHLLLLFTKTFPLFSAKSRHCWLLVVFTHFSTIFCNLGLFFLLSPSLFIWCQNFWILVRFGCLLLKIGFRPYNYVVVFQLFLSFFFFNLPILLIYLFWFWYDKICLSWDFFFCCVEIELWFIMPFWVFWFSIWCWFGLFAGFRATSV